MSWSFGPGILKKSERARKLEKKMETLCLHCADLSTWYYGIRSGTQLVYKRASTEILLHSNAALQKYLLPYLPWPKHACRRGGGAGSDSGPLVNHGGINNCNRMYSQCLVTRSDIQLLLKGRALSTHILKLLLLPIWAVPVYNCSK